MITTVVNKYNNVISILFVALCQGIRSTSGGLPQFRCIDKW